MRVGLWAGLPHCTARVGYWIWRRQHVQSCRVRVRCSASKSGFSATLSLPRSPPAPPKPRLPSTQKPQLLRCPCACPYTWPHSVLSCPSPSSVDTSPSAHPVTLWPRRPCRPGLRAGQIAQVPRSQAQLSEWTCHRVIHRSWSPVLEAPTYLWEWQVGAGPARRPHSLCLPRTRSPHLHPASWGWINGPESWLGCLALVLCGLWPQAPWAYCWAQDSTVTVFR